VLLLREFRFLGPDDETVRRGQCIVAWTKVLGRYFGSPPLVTNITAVVHLLRYRFCEANHRKPVPELNRAATCSWRAGPRRGETYVHLG
jgi:hypothetical protein